MNDPKHIKDVKDFFNQTEIYLIKNFNLKIRREIIENWLKNKTSLKIVDLGCGNGEVSINLGKNNDVTLVDISENMLALAKKNFETHQSKISNQYCGDLESWKVNQHFDVIICCGVLAHCPSIVKTLQKISSLLNPGGKLILQFTNADSWLGRIRLKLAKLLKKNKNHHSYTLNEIKKDDLLKELNNNNLFVIDQTSYNLFIPKFSLVPNSILYILTKLSLASPVPGSEIFLLCEKN